MSVMKGYDMYKIYLTSDAEELEEILDAIKLGIDKKDVANTNPIKNKVLGKLEQYKHCVCKYVLSVDLSHDIGSACVLNLKLSENINESYGLMFHDEHGLIMCGQLSKCSYDANSNSYHMQLVACMDDYNLTVDDLQKQSRLKNRFLRNKNYDGFLKNLLVDRCTGEVSLLDRYKVMNNGVSCIDEGNKDDGSDEKCLYRYSGIKRINKFLPHTIRCEQTSDAVREVVFNFHASWNVYCNGKTLVKKVLKDISADIDTIKKLVPQRGMPYSNYRIEDNYEPKIFNSRYEDVYKTDVQVQFDLSWMHTVSREEVCQIKLHVPVSPNVSSRKAADIDFYCDLNPDTVEYEEWTADKMYVQSMLVSYKGYKYECIVSHYSDAKTCPSMNVDNKDYDKSDEVESKIDDSVATDLKETKNSPWKFVCAIEDDDQFANAISVFVDQRERLLKEALRVVEEYCDTSTNIFKISLELPITADNICLAVGDCIDLTDYGFVKIAEVGFIEHFELRLNQKETFIRVIIRAQAAMCQMDESLMLDKKELRCLRYDDISDKYPVDASARVLELKTSPQIIETDYRYNVINADECIDNIIEIRAVYCV